MNQSRTAPASTEALLPVKLGSGHVHYARGVRAGPWVFATGLMATDFSGHSDPEIVHPRLPLFGEPPHQEEAAVLFQRAQEVLMAGGTDFGHVVRLDQFYSDWRAVDHYQTARRKAFGHYVPPSTSILEEGLLLPGAAIEASLIAVAPGAFRRIEAFTPAELDVPARAGFSPIVAVDDFIFVAGFMAAHKPGDLGGIAPEAQVPTGHLWKGTRIKLETEYLIQHKLIPALKAGGASVESVVKAYVYLADIADLPAFNSVWRSYFGRSPIATTIIPTSRPGFAIVDATIEINVLALREGGAVAKETVECPTFIGFIGQPAAVRAGDLLLISGMMAVDQNGPAPGVLTDVDAPYFGSSIEKQMEHILSVASDICLRAGTSLRNVLRIQHFHTELAEFYPAYQVWRGRFPDLPLPFSALRVPTPLPAEGCTVMVDLWVHIPGTAL